MKVEQVSNRPSLEVVSIVTFDPWPFKDTDVVLSDAVAYVDHHGKIFDGGGLGLGGNDNRLVALSDGRVAVASADWDGRTLVVGGVS